MRRQKKLLGAREAAACNSLRLELQRAETEQSAQRAALSRLLADELHRSESEHARQLDEMLADAAAERDASAKRAAALAAALESTRSDASQQLSPHRAESAALRADATDLQAKVESLQDGARAFNAGRSASCSHARPCSVCALPSPGCSAVRPYHLR